MDERLARICTFRERLFHWFFVLLLVLFYLSIPGDQAEIVSHPQAIVTEEEGSNLTLFCNATGNPAANVSWTKDGSLINSNSRINFSEDNKRLNIRNVIRNDKGSYRCVANNSLGNDASDVSTVDIQYRPEIVTQPQNVTETEGKTVTLTCNATGNPGPELSWFNDEHLVKSSNRISLSAGNQSLIIANANRTDSGKYLCVAHNEVGNAPSKIAVLNVQYQPEIITDPSDDVVKEGRNTTLYCNTTGNPLPEILWEKNGNPISKNSRISYSAESKELKIINVDRKDGGTYRCVAVNRIGNATSRNATLVVKYPPEIVTQPQNVTETEGKNVTLTCNVTGNPEPELLWFNDEHLVKSSKRISLSAGNQSLMITNVNRTDSGKYLCVVHNEVGNASSKIAVLNVQYRPEILTDPSDDVVKEGKNTTLYCNATGNPLPEISWEKNGNPIGNNSKISHSELKIINAYRTEGGTYRCVAVNNVGNATSHNATLVVKYRPEIVNEPQNVTKTEGKNVTLTCNATGNPEPELSWFNDGHPVKSNNRICLSVGNQSLMIANVNRTDSGKYLCVAHNEVGNATSKVAILNVQYQPEIITDPSDAVVKEGENTTLYCNATGNPLPEILWEKNGNPISNNSRISYLAENKELKIINVDRTDSGTYRCVAVNRIGNATSSNATFVVKYRPEIVTQPQNVTETEGKNVTLTCNATGNPEPELSWFNDEHLVKSSNRISLSAGNQSLMIANVNRTDSGKYQCVASNEVGNASSKIAILNVQYQPEIITYPSDDVAKEGKNTTLYCNATGNPLPEISWEKSGNPIGDNSKTSYSELKIINAYRTDSGKYRCVAVNRIGRATSRNATLSVEYQSKITTHPSNETKREGENVTLHCNATGYPPPALSWTKDGSDISNNSKISFSADKEQLAITNTSRVDSGAYRCVASNRLGNDTSRAAFVDVQFAPGISVPPRSVTIVKGEHVTFTCSVAGNPTPSVIWTKNGEDLDVTANSRLKLSSRNHSHSLEIAEVDISDSGQYICLANNSVDRSSSSAATLTVQYVPNPPKDIKVISRGSRLINISWTADFNGNSAIQNYTVEIREDGQRFRDAICQRTLLVNACVISATKVSIKELFPWTTYYLRAFARNRIGSSNYSFVVGVTTHEEEPSAAPSSVRGRNSSSTSILVEWDEVPGPDRNGIIKSYNITYHSLTESDSNSTVVEYPDRQVTLTGLKVFLNYNITVSASTKIGPGPASYPIIVITDEDKPSAPPANVKGRNTSSTRILVEWGKVPSADRNGIITSYSVTYHSLTENHSDSATVDFPGCQVTLTGLKEFVNYSITVFASTVVGNGPASDPIFVRSDQDRPSRGPENVSSSEVNYTTNKITWVTLPKEAANGFIELYEVRFELKESCLKVDSTFHAMNITKSSVLLTDFWMCAKYEVSIRGYTVAGPGPYSKAIVVQTKSLKLSKIWSKEAPSSPSFSQTSSGEGITAKITLPRFPGNAKFFQVIVIIYSLDFTGVVNSPDSFTPNDLMTYEEAHKSSVPAAYVTFQFRGNDSDAFREFFVGDGAHSNTKKRKRRSSDGEDFLNKPLQPNTKYRVFLRAFIDKTVFISSNFVTIETKGKPNVKGLLERTIFQVGDVVVLTCEATGDPKPSVTWSKDGNINISRAQLRNDGHILVIQEVAPRDGGIYECRASNIFGQRRAATAVIIAVPPSIRKDVSPPSVICAKDTPCTLLCHATSDTPFHYSWTRNGHALNGRNIKVINNTVIVTPLDDQDFGDYVCHATNLFGSTTHKITLSESLEEEHNVQSIFRAGDIAWSCIVFVLLVLIGLLIRRLRRAQAINRTATAEKANIVDVVQSALPLEQRMSEPASYMELHSRPLDGQTRVPSEYQSLQGGHANAGYYNVVLEEGNKKGPSEEIYEEIELYDC